MNRSNRLTIFFTLSLAVACQAIAQHVSYRFTPHYNERVDLFEKLNDLDSTKIVMLGNSLTELGGDWNERLKADNVINRGISGDDALGITSRLIQILPKHPKAIFLMCGTNDLSHDLTPQQVFEKCKGVIDSIRSGAPDVKLYVQSLLPINESFGRWKTLESKTDDIPKINELLNRYCYEQHITYIDLFPRFTRGRSNILMKSLSVDGLHLSKQGYKVWGHQLSRYVREANQ